MLLEGLYSPNKDRFLNNFGMIVYETAMTIRVKSTKIKVLNNPRDITTKS